MRERIIDFFVPGQPRPQGSAAWIRNPATGKSIPKRNEHLENWRGAIALYADQMMNHYKMARIEKDAVGLSLTFVFERPKGHFGTGRNAHKIKGSAPDRHLQTPDLDKLIRAVNDSLTMVMYADDKQVDHIVALKGWGPRAGVQICVRGEKHAMRGRKKEDNQEEENQEEGRKEE